MTTVRAATATRAGTTAGTGRSAVLRGQTEAHGFVLDTPLVGGAEAARRVFGLWQRGAELRLLPDGRWLLLLPRPVALRAELGPGIALQDYRGGSVTLPDPDGDLSVPWRGLPTVALTEWLSTTPKPVRRLAVLDLPAPVPAVPQAMTSVAAPDLRAAARVRPSGRAVRVHRDLDGRGSRFGTVRVARSVAVTATLMTAVALVVLVVTQLRGSTPSVPSSIPPPPPVATGTTPDTANTTDTTDTTINPLTCQTSLPSYGTISVPCPDYAGSSTSGSGNHGSHWTFLPIPALLMAGRMGYTAYQRRTGGTRNGARGSARRAAGAPPKGRLRSLLARLTLRSPARGFVQGRHRRYVQNLTEAFERRDYDRALRDAIVLNSERRSTLTRLRIALPRPRTGALAPTAVAPAASGSPAWAPTVYAHLHVLYTEAGVRLEQAGRIDEAAFLYADLMRSAPKAVALLERAARFRQAAELAEGRRLEPDLVVRLWWRAGDRDRAVDVARARGAFASAVGRLDPLDPEAARGLRAAWIGALREAGDHLRAVEVAWPDAELRAAAPPDIEAGMAVGGLRAARLLAYQNALSPEAARAGILRLLAGRDEASRPARAEFLRAFVTVGAEEPGAWDREAATRALRTLVADRGCALPSQEMRKTYDALAARADPLAAADLRRPALPQPKPGGHVEVVMPATAGRLPVADAVGLDDGTVLVACGEAGVRILTPDGRTAAAWEVPAHRIVSADHGGCALLVAGRNDVAEFRRLDLATRKVDYWTTLEVKQVATTFDGSTLIVVDADGIAVLAVDPAAPRPRVIWRELDRAWNVRFLERTPTSVAAWLDDSRNELNRWRWDLPGWTLRQRTTGLVPPAPRWSEGTEDRGFVMTFGGEEEAGRVRLVYPDGQPLDGDGEPVRFQAREEGARTTLLDSSGRVVVVEAGRLVSVVGVR